MFGVVRRLTAEGVGVIWISHRLGEVGELGDVVTVLKEGRTVATELPPDTPVDTLIRHMVGGRMEALFPDRGPSRETTVLDVRGLTRAPDVFDASFTLREGEILGLAGLVGSGRTELLRLIYGLDPAQSGEVEVGGRRLPPGRPDLAIRAGLGFAPEERKSEGLWLDWSLIRNTSIADLSRFRRGPFTDRARRATRSHPPSTVSEHPARRSRAAGEAVLRGQPAEGGSGPLAVAFLPRAVTGRTDSGCRRRRPVGDLPSDRRAGRQRDRNRHGFQ